MILSSIANMVENRSLVTKCLIAIALVSGSIATAKDSTPNESMTRFSSSSSNNTSSSVSQEQLANMYGLDMTQWVQYQTVLKGPRGLWSPNIHPLMALGMRKGITERERRKLAKQYATIRYERVERELAFEHAVFEEAMKMYGHIPLFKEGFNTSTLPTSDKNTAKTNERIQYFVRSKCSQCKSVIQGWISQGQKFDLYIAGNKKQITQFAKNMGISPLLVPQTISLNPMSETEMASLGIKKLPTIRRKGSK